MKTGSTSDPRTEKTRSAILDAAEVLFVRQGMSATSLRAIIARARVNVAAVHYHFGSRPRLLEAVFDRAMSPLTERRLERLHAAETTEELVRALFLPLFELVSEGSKRRRTRGLRAIRTIAAFRDDSRESARILERHENVTLASFTRSFARALPTLSRAQLLLRLRFATSAAWEWVSLPDFARELEGAEAAERAFAELSAFVVPGLEAPAPGLRKV